MITSYVDESPTKKVLTFEVPADDVRKATDRTVKALREAGAPARASGPERSRRT